MIRGLLNLPNDDSRKIIFVAVTLCLVCSLMVSTAAVLLAPIQAAEKQESLRRNVLITAGLLDADDEDANVAQLFMQMEAQIVDLDTGEFASNINALSFDPVRARRDPALSDELDECRGGRLQYRCRSEFFRTR
jgi:Na+-transporting NADH:ubiquinone oxidoreductase subunit C